MSSQEGEHAGDLDLQGDARSNPLRRRDGESEEFRDSEVASIEEIVPETFTGVRHTTQTR
jgi:hypothetical protein